MTDDRREYTVLDGYGCGLIGFAAVVFSFLAAMCVGILYGMWKRGEL